MVRRLLTTAGVIEPGQRRPRTIPERQPDEWTIRELAEELGVPQPTLYNWVQKGRLPSRSIIAGAGSAKLITADAATIANLKTIRATPPPWRRLPPPVRSPTIHPLMLESRHAWFEDRRAEPIAIAGPLLWPRCGLPISQRCPRWPVRSFVLSRAGSHCIPSQ